MGKKGDEVHVVINKNFVCPRVDGPTDVGYKQTVPAILPEGMTTYVHYSGHKEPKSLKGTAEWDPDNPN